MPKRFIRKFDAASYKHGARGIYSMAIRTRGDYVTLLARMDLVAACSACPQDLAPTNAGRVSDLAVRLA